MSELEPKFFFLRPQAQKLLKLVLQTQQKNKNKNSSFKWNQVGFHLIDRQHTGGMSLSCAAGPFTALMAAMCRRRPEAAAHFSPAVLCCLGSSRDRFQLGLFSAAVYCLLPLPWQIGADLSASSTPGDSDGWPGGGAGWQSEVRPGDRQPVDRFSLAGDERGWSRVVGGVSGWGCGRWKPLASSCCTLLLFAWRQN